MALPKIKLSQMSVANTINATDYLMIVQDGVNKKTTITNLLTNLNAADNFRINPNQLSLNFYVASKNSPNALFVSGNNSYVGINTPSPTSLLHVNGNCQIGSATTDGITIESTENVIYTAANQIGNGSSADTLTISVSRAATLLSCQTGVTGHFSLPYGSDGQLKTITVNTLDIGQTIIMSMSGLGFNQLSFPSTSTSVVGNSVSLRFFSSLNKWAVVGNNGCVISQV